MRIFARTMLVGALAALVLSPHRAAAVDLTMYYPVAVGGPVTKIVDDMVGRFEKENPDIKVTAVYAGNYTDTMTKAMTAMKGGQPPQLSVLLSTDVFTLIDENAIVPFDSLVTDKAWFKDFYPAFMANGQIDGKTWSIPFQRSTIVLCEFEGQSVSVRQDGFSKAAPGDEIRLSWTDGDEHQFDQATGARLAPQQRRST